MGTSLKEKLIPMLLLPSKKYRPSSNTERTAKEVAITIPKREIVLKILKWLSSSRITENLESDQLYLLESSRNQINTSSFFKAKQQVHVLYRLTRSPLYHVIKHRYHLQHFSTIYHIHLHIAIV